MSLISKDLLSISRIDTYAVTTIWANTYFDCHSTGCTGKSTPSYLSIKYLILSIHDDVIKWKHFLRYWPFVREIHWSSVNPPHKFQWRGDSMFFLICVWINGWVNNREAPDLRRHCVHYDCNDLLVASTPTYSQLKALVIHFHILELSLSFIKLELLHATNCAPYSAKFVSSECTHLYDNLFCAIIEENHGIRPAVDIFGKYIKKAIYAILHTKYECNYLFAQ